VGTVVKGAVGIKVDEERSEDVVCANDELETSEPVAKDERTIEELVKAEDEICRDAEDEETTKEVETVDWVDTDKLI
jgi:hypothetical protein